MTQQVQTIIDKIVADSVKDIANSLDCTDTLASEEYAHAIHAMTYPKVEKPKRVRGKVTSRRTPTYKRITFTQLQNKYWYDAERGELRYKRDGFKYLKDTKAWWYGNGADRLKMIYNDGLNYHHARLVWFYHKGIMSREILHLNGDKLDDRIENLQDADHATMCAHAPQRGKDIGTRKTRDNADNFFAFPDTEELPPTPELVVPVELEEEVEEVADPIAPIDGGIFHRDVEKPWSVFVIASDGMKQYGSYYTIAEAYAVWRNMR